MRFGCCGNLASTRPDGIGLEILEDAVKFGFDYIELPLAEMTALSDADFNSLLERVGKSGIKCEVCNNLFPSSIRLTGKNVDEKVITCYLERALFRAHRLGAEVVVFGSGGAKNVPDGFPFDEAYKQVVRETKLVASIARKYGITIVIEPIRKPECNIINTYSEGVALAEKAGEPNVLVLVDFYHLTWEKEDPADLVKGGKWLRHIHFANPNLSSEKGRIYPEDESEFDYAPFRSALREIGYNGRMSIEAGCDPDFVTQAPKAIEFMKRYFN